jgi:hypothetical protein
MYFRYFPLIRSVQHNKLTIYVYHRECTANNSFLIIFIRCHMNGNGVDEEDGEEDGDVSGDREGDREGYSCGKMERDIKKCASRMKVMY